MSWLQFAKVGYYKNTNTINETNFIANYKWTGLHRIVSRYGFFDYDSYYYKKTLRCIICYLLTETTVK